MSKNSMVDLVGALGNRAGLIDGITEAGAAVGDCDKNGWDVFFRSALQVVIWLATLDQINGVRMVGSMLQHLLLQA